LIYVHNQNLKRKAPAALDMLSRQYRRRFFTVVTLFFFQQFGGIGFFIFYSTKIFSDVGQDGNVATMIMNIANLAGGIMAMYTVPKFGRKPSFVIGILAQAATWLAFCTMKYYDSWALLYPICSFYMISYSMGVAAPSFPWVAETLPPIGCSVAWFFQLVFATVVGKYSPIMADGWPGLLPLSIFFVVVCVVGSVVLDYLCVETKDKSTEKIGEEYLEFKYRPCNWD
jgi:MFS family permease